MNQKSPHHKLYIGVDLGGTNIVCGAVTPEGTVLNKIKRPTEAAQGYGAVVAKIAGMIAEAAALSVECGTVEAVGLGCPGIVDPERGVSVDSSNLGWRGVPVAGELERLTGLPVFVDNDVRMYVYGESMIGAGKDHRNVLGVTIGTGLACAFVQENRLFYGSGFMAGELGHIRADGVEYACNCGKIGCFETVVSATGIARQAAEQLRRGRNSVLRARFADNDFNRLTSADVSDGYDQQDPLCMEVMTRTGRLLGHSLALAATLYSPDVIIVGGGASLAGERLLAPARETLYTELLPVFRNRIALKPAALTDDAGVAGSALHASGKMQSPGG